MKGQSQEDLLQYWNHANFEILYFFSEKWKSELSFYEDELEFMQNLLQKHFLYFFDKERRILSVPLANQLSKMLKSDLEQLEKDIQLHENKLADLIKLENVKEEKIFRNEHARLDKRFDEFKEKYQLAKKEVFLIAEDVLKEEKMKLLTTT